MGWNIGPFKVLERYGKCFKLQLYRKIYIVSIDRLKSAFIPTNNQSDKETLIDFDHNIENNRQRNNEENDNAVPKNQQQI